MKRFLILVPLLCWAQLTYGQGAFIPSKTVTSVVNGIQRPVSGASITVCAASTSGLPCSPALANSVWKDSALTQAQTNPSFTDANGNYPPIALAGGQYTITETSAGFTGFSYQVSVTCGVGPCTATSLTVTGTATFTGNNTHSGTETFLNLNDILWVGPGAGSYNTIAAAVAAAGSNQTIIAIRSTYAGTECPAATTATLTFWDFRGGSETCTQNSVSWNQVSGGGLHSFARFIQTRNSSPSNSDTTLYGQGFYAGTLPANAALVGTAGECDLIGAITTPGNTTCAGMESDVVLNSTGGTLFQVFGLNTNIGSKVGNTTNVTNAYGIYLPEYTKLGTETITNNYGLVVEPRLAGGTNTALWDKGNSRFDDTMTLDKNTAGTAVAISGDSISNTTPIQIADTHAGGHTWNLGETVGAAEFSLRDVSVAGGPYWSFLFGGTGLNGGRFTHSNTTARTYTFPDASGTVAFNPPAVAGTTDLGTTALPFGNLWLGTAATNNFKFQPAATAAARIISMPDPLGAVNMPYVIASGTSTLTSNATLAAVTSQAAITTAATNTLTTDSIEWSYATAPTAGDSLCHVSPYVTAGNVNFVRTNPTAAAQNVSALVINWRVIR